MKRKAFLTIAIMLVLSLTTIAQTQSATTITATKTDNTVLLSPAQFTLAGADTALSNWYPTSALLHDDSLKYLTSFDIDGDSASVTILLQSTNDETNIWTAETIASANTTLTAQKIADGTPQSLLGAKVRFWIINTYAATITIDLDQFYITK